MSSASVAHRASQPARRRPGDLPARASRIDLRQSAHNTIKMIRAAEPNLNLLGTSLWILGPGNPWGVERVFGFTLIHALGHNGLEICAQHRTGNRTRP